MTAKKEQEPGKTTITGLDFIEPDKYYFSNVVRTYTTGPEIFIEFARTPAATPGEKFQVKGEVGVVMTLPGITALMHHLQLSMQNAMKAMQKMQEEAASKESPDLQTEIVNMSEGDDNNGETD
ncbi:MAG: hypothetical protein AB7T01_11045 [Acidithiobacillus sp.]